MMVVEFNKYDIIFKIPYTSSDMVADIKNNAGLINSNDILWMASDDNEHPKFTNSLFCYTISNVDDILKYNIDYDLFSTCNSMQIDLYVGRLITKNRINKLNEILSDNGIDV